MHKRRWAKWMAAFLDLFEKDHAEKAIEEDEGKNRTVE